MGTFKSKKLKQKLSKALTQNRRIPVFVIAKTKRGVAYNTRSRNWRRQKLKLKGMK